MSETKDFFSRVKSWCKENRTTIKALMADCSGGEWNKDTYFGWRSGNSLPKGENIARLARFMGVSCDWLITGEEENGLTEREEEAVRMCQRLSSANLLRWMDFGAGLLSGQGAFMPERQGDLAFEKGRTQKTGA